MIVRAAPRLLALFALGLASCNEPQQPPPQPDPLDQLFQACTKYDQVEALIRQINAERAGLPPPPPAFGEARAKCPRGTQRLLTEPLKSLKEEWARTNPPPETRLQQLERIGRQSADDIVRLARTSRLP